jgi:hypothetical protein
MHSIIKKAYGFHLVFDGFITKSEMEQWVADAKTNLRGASKAFGVTIDMRGLKPLLPEVKTVMEEGQKEFKGAGMTRSAVILSSAMISMMFKNIAKESGIYQWERYINTEQTPAWESVAIAWVERGIDPDAGK